MSEPSDAFPEPTRYRSASAPPVRPRQPRPLPAPPGLRDRVAQLPPVSAVPIRLPEAQSFQAFRTGGGHPAPARFDLPVALDQLAGPGAADRIPTQAARSGRRVGLRRRWRRVQWVMLEGAAALAVLGSVSGIAGRCAAWAAAALLLVLAVVPVGGRWLYAVVLSAVGLTRRRRASGRWGGLEGVLGRYEVTSVAGLGDTRIGAIRVGTAWTIALEVMTDDLFNGDAAVSVADLEAMLEIEDVPLAAVRLLTGIAPARPGVGASPAAPLLGRATARHCLLTVDTRLAAAALAARGGSQAAIEQVLRRCALRAEEVLRQSGVSVRALDAAALQRLVDGCLGPEARLQDPAAPPPRTEEQWNAVLVGGTCSTTMAAVGGVSQVCRALAEIGPYLPGALCASVLVVQRPPLQATTVSSYLRASSPAGDGVGGGALQAALRAAASVVGLELISVGGDQAAAFGLTTPLGAPA